MNNSDHHSDIEELNSREVSRVVPTITYLGLLIITGSFGNILVFYVYKTKYGLSNTKYYILCLSVIDLFTCCVVLPLEITTMTMQYNFRYPWLCKASRFGNTISTLSSAAILMVIATDRYRRMCKPFGWQIARKYAKILCACCIFFGVSVSWPALFIFSRMSVVIHPFNVTGTDCSIGEDMKDSVIPLVNIIVLTGMFSVGMVFIIVMYCCIWVAMHKHSKRLPGGSIATTKRRLTGQMPLSIMSLSAVHVNVQEGLYSNDVENNPYTSSSTVNNGASSSNTSCDVASVTPQSAHRRSEASSSFSHQSSNVRKTSVLMLLVSVTFIVSYLPNILLILIREIDNTFEENMSDTERAAYKFFLRSYFLNCATNPVIYCIYGSQFRATCKQLLLSFCGRSK